MFRLGIVSPANIIYVNGNLWVCKSSTPICVETTIAVICITCIYWSILETSYLNCSLMIWTAPPLAKGGINSNTDASKEKDECIRCRVPIPCGNLALVHNIIDNIPSCCTITPFGFPVEPEVYIIYAMSGEGNGLPSHSCHMNCFRSSGYSGSIGTYAEPAFQMPNTVTTNSFTRGISTQTKVPGITDLAYSSEALLSSPYVNWLFISTTATASGVFTTCSRNKSMNVLDLS